MRLLLLEDDATLGEALSGFLRLEGHVVDWFQRLGDARAVMGEPFDVLLIDWQLPDGSGVDWVRQLRAQGRTMPIFVLTARDLLQDRIHGLDSGADDYLVKPFAITELVARLRALVRRHEMRRGETLVLAALRYDAAAHRAMIDDKPIHLSARECIVLQYLLLKTGQIVARDQLATLVPGWDAGTSDNALELLMSRLRAKIEPGGVRLRTVRGLGYRLEPAAAA